MGGSPPKPQSGPSPQQIAQMQVDAQRREQERLTGERNTNADNFLANNAVSDGFRNDIGDRSQGTTEKQLGVLNQQYGSTLDDIRQRQAGRGMIDSSTRLGLDRQAGILNDQSRNDILSAGQRRVEERMNQQNTLLNRAANAIRGGTPISIAENQYQTDLESANKSFDYGLQTARSKDQRNSAFLDFESNRQRSASRFKESVGRMQDDELLAARAVAKSPEEEADGAGQFGSATTNII